MNGITLAFSITDLHSSTMNKKSRRPSSAKAKRDSELQDLSLEVTRLLLSLRYAMICPTQIKCAGRIPRMTIDRITVGRRATVRLAPPVDHHLPLVLLIVPCIRIATNSFVMMLIVVVSYLKISRTSIHFSALLTL